MQGRLPVGWLKLGLSLTGLNADIDTVRGTVTEVVEASHRRLMKLDISVTVVMVLIGLLISLFMARRLVRPIQALGDYTRRIGAGHYDDDPPFERSDELGDLARSLALMSRDLKRVMQVSRLATLGEMAVGMAHELSQPLHTIRLAVENTLMLMEQGKTDSAFEKEKLELISQQADSMGDLMRRMCVVGRNETLRDVINPCESVRDAQALLSGQFESEGITIAVDMPEKCTAVLGRRNELAQVLINLLTNAFDAIVESASGRKGRFTPLGGRIEIAVQEVPGPDSVSSGEVLIKVKDNGGGVPPEIIDRVFDPFFTTKDVGKGTGLGLSISYGLVKEMGGSLSVENFGGGALFTIRLPVARDNVCTI